MSLDMENLDRSDWSVAFSKFTTAFHVAANGPSLPEKLDAEILRELHKNLG